MVPTVTVNGYNFTPLKSVTVKFYFPASATTPEKTVTGTVGCNGFFSASFTPATLDIGTGKVTATDSGSPARSATVTLLVS